MNWYKIAKRDIPGLASLEQEGRRFETGVPVEFEYSRNTQPAPNYGPEFQQDIEPSGRYMTKSYPNSQLDYLETGNIKFENPLVMYLTESEERIYGDKSWKKRLHDAYDGLTGKALSRAIAKDGYDGVVTVSTYRGKPVETSEIVDLRMFRGNK